MERFFDMPVDFRVTKVKRDASQGVQDPHTHPYYEIFYLINGDCTFFINHNIYKLLFLRVRYIIPLIRKKEAAKDL